MTLGTRLKNAREDLGVNLKKFSDLSKIRVKYLEYLEHDEFDKLPAFVYIQGFLKKYSQILDLPLEELMEQYQQEKGENRINEQKNVAELPMLNSPKMIITPKKITLAIIGLIVLVVAGYLVYQLDFLVAAPNLVLNYPAQDITVDQPTIKISGVSSAAAKLSVNGQQIFIDKDGSFSQEINLSPGVNILTIDASSRFGKTSEVVRRVFLK